MKRIVFCLMILITVASNAQTDNITRRTVQTANSKEKQGVQSKVQGNVMDGKSTVSAYQKVLSDIPYDNESAASTHYNATNRKELDVNNLSPGTYFFENRIEVSLRKSADASSDVIVELPKSFYATITYSFGEFYQIKYMQYTGYVKKVSISKASMKTDNSQSMESNGTISVRFDNSIEVAMRQYPDASSDIIYTLPKSFYAVIESSVGEFYRIRYRNVVGYVKKVSVHVQY